MKIAQVAAQLYTLRDYLKTPEAIAETLAKVAAIGYQAVQISGMGPIAEADLVALCRQHGLTICATHEPAAKLLAEPEAAIARLQKLGCRHTAYPHPAGIDFSSEAAVSAWLEQLDRAAKAFAAAGLTLSYHNHQNEFRKLGGRTIIERIYAETSILAELDTYWVQAGGGNPVAWVKRFPGRQPLLHLKDYAISPADNKTPMFAEIGAGNLDFPAICAAADAAGVEWFIVEQDVCPGSPFDSLAQSFTYLRDQIARG